FIFTVDDGGTIEGDAGEFPDVSTSFPANVNILVASNNNSPTVTGPNAITTNEDTAHEFLFSGVDADDGDTLTYIIVTPPTKGTLTGAGSNRTYTPNENANGSDSFTFKANDGTVDSTVATVSITINAINDVPVAHSQPAVTTPEDTSISITLWGTDVESTGLIYTIASNPTNGTLSGSGNAVSYTPNDNFYGNDSFTFTVSDGDLVSTSATVYIRVTGQNDAPVIIIQAFITKEDTSIDITFTGSDQENDALTYSILTHPTNGVLTGTGDTRTYTPNLNFNGTDSFNFKANDGTSDSASATVNLTITSVNDQPLANTGTSAIGEDSAEVEFNLSGTDVDGDPLSYIVVSNPTKGTLSGSGSTRHYVPNANANGTDSFDFKVNDGTVDSTTATYTINITAVNNVPYANTQNFEIIEDSAACTINLPMVTH
ncbi:MAG: cadherin-like domain-containing protein, partial [Psychrosphaera sp.]|nr:cadherin-like domain-containing protein [Psychrosphaera sp.]